LARASPLLDQVELVAGKDMSTFDDGDQGVAFEKPAQCTLADGVLDCSFARLDVAYLKATGSGRTTRRRLEFKGAAAPAAALSDLCCCEAVRASDRSSSRCTLGSRATVGNPSRRDIGKAVLGRRCQQPNGALLRTKDPKLLGSFTGRPPCQQQGNRAKRDKTPPDPSWGRPGGEGWRVAGAEVVELGVGGRRIALVEPEERCFRKGIYRREGGLQEPSWSWLVQPACDAMGRIRHSVSYQLLITIQLYRTQCNYLCVKSIIKP
jgi:hypothetical protein